MPENGRNTEPRPGTGARVKCEHPRIVDHGPWNKFQLGVVGR